MSRDLMIFDPCDPPPGLGEHEAMLWQGRCPHCGEASAFRWSDDTQTKRVDPNDATKDEVISGALVCQYCGLEFEGCQPQADSKPELRRLNAVRKMGRSDRRTAAGGRLVGRQPI